MSAPVSDLTAHARIRNAALELFADRGVAATSVRDVAALAKVSSGLVQHHFKNKAGLRDAVNDHVVAVAGEAFAELPASGDPTAVQQQLGERVTAFVRDHAMALRYVARGVADRDAGALAIFDEFVGISARQWSRLSEHGLLRPDAPLEWAALQVVVLNLATMLMSEAIERHVPAAFTDPEQLEIWDQASNALFQHGLYRDD